MGDWAADGSPDRPERLRTGVVVPDEGTVTYCASGDSLGMTLVISLADELVTVAVPPKVYIPEL